MYPLPSFSASRGMRIEAPRFATRLEFFDATGLMCTRQTLVVALTVLVDVLLCYFSKGLANLDNHVVPTVSTHGLDGEVCVTSCTIPVTISRLGREAALDIVDFGESKHNVPGHEEMIAHFDATAWSHLEFPLARHHLCVFPCNLHACLDALRVVIICNSAADGAACASTTIIRTLRRWLTSIHVETQRLRGKFSNLRGVHESVLLLDAEPWVVILVLVHNVSAGSPCVTNRGFAIPSIPYIAQDQDIWRTTEGIFEDGPWL